MKAILKRDIVIKAGTVFDDAPALTQRAPDHVETIIGLTKDSHGVLVYDVVDDPALSEWFEVTE